MALEQHTNVPLRYWQQVENSRNYVLPFIEKAIPVKSGMTVLEIGCAEGGVLVPFLEKGCMVVGVDLNEERINTANEYNKEAVDKGMAAFRAQNVYDESFVAEFDHYFDIIILKDAIEHIPAQEQFIPHLKKLLKPGGQIYFGFPPWYMPHGGHQQICANKFLSMLPYFHLLPKPLYRGIVKMFGEDKGIIKELMDIKATGITIERFEKIVHNTGFRVTNKQHYLLNPIYKYKFKVNPRKQSPIISAIPYVRDFLTTCVYYTITPV
ncbi:class I SAM-dependent methyltransferase [Foetidibacter luteolus]|uniref:class I SAM-dependent methyltransferase n=1 Tax=Foetidibacter luteolus TaxID=2608880 RepID=UPI00129B80E1|nr:methyltransferase domain-containing protein [Foetidibacter luteolus]